MRNTFFSRNENKIEIIDTSYQTIQYFQNYYKKCGQNTSLTLFNVCQPSWKLTVGLPDKDHKVRGETNV